MFKPGIYENLDIEKYHASYGISSSGIKSFIEAPAQYYYDYRILPTLKDEETIAKENQAYATGKAVHVLALEPHLFDQQFYVFEGKSLPGKEPAKSRLAAIAKGRTVVKTKDLDEAREMAASLASHPLLKSMTNKKVEHSFFWEEGVLNAPLRSRPDVYDDRIIVDIKTCADFKTFERNFKSYGYHRQTAMQIDGVRKLTGTDREFLFLVIQKKAPYLVAQYEMEFFDINEGRFEYRQVANSYAECLLYNEWPTNCDTIRTLKSYRPRINQGAFNYE